MNSNIHLVKSSSLQNVGPLPISQPRIPGDDNSLQGLNLSFVKVTAPTKSQRHVFDKLKHERAAPELKTGNFHHLKQNYPTRLTGRERKLKTTLPRIKRWKKPWSMRGSTSRLGVISTTLCPLTQRARSPRVQCVFCCKSEGISTSKMAGRKTTPTGQFLFSCDRVSCVNVEGT